VPADSQDIAYVTVFDGDDERLLVAPLGARLRDVLRRNGISPHSRATRRLNCGGRGLCATCGVRVRDDVSATHWHDALAATFGYPRLSCQITVDRSLTVYLLPDKTIWGGRLTE